MDLKAENAAVPPPIRRYGTSGGIELELVGDLIFSFLCNLSFFSVETKKIHQESYVILSHLFCV